MRKTKRTCYTISELARAAREIADWLEWDSQTISDFHLYAQRFGGTPGGNVLGFTLGDALTLRGMTVEQLRGEVEVARGKRKPGLYALRLTPHQARLIADLHLQEHVGPDMTHTSHITVGDARAMLDIIPREGHTGMALRRKLAAIVQADERRKGLAG